MKKDNQNLDKLFEKARRQDPLISRDDAREFIEAGGYHVPKSNNFSLFRGANKMMWISSAAAIVAAVGYLAFNPFRGSQHEASYDSSQAVISPKYKESNLYMEVPPSKSEKKTNIENFSFNAKTVDKNEYSVYTPPNNIKGIKSIKLTPGQLRELGIEVKESEGKLRIHDRINKAILETDFLADNETLYLKEINNSDAELVSNSLRVVTDNIGTKRLIKFDSDEVKNYYTKSDSRVELRNYYKDGGADQQSRKMSSTQLKVMILDSIRGSIEEITNKIKDSTLKWNINNEIDRIKLKIPDSSIKKQLSVSIKREKPDSLIGFSDQGKVAVEKVLELIEKIVTDSLGNKPEIPELENLKIDQLSEELDKYSRLHEKLDEYVKINKFVPVEVPVYSKKHKDFSFILWFEPDEEFLTKLPDEIRRKLEPELEALKNAESVCEAAPIVGEDTYLDIWRSCGENVNELAIYPNPATEVVSIEFMLKNNSFVEVVLHDVNGSEIKPLDKFTAPEGFVSRKLDLGKLPSGMYLISVRAGSAAPAVQRIIIK
ncbi:MAG: T9SS type A sorting domain-containing protein [Candidatus Kapaibacterium sp.]